MRIIHCLPLAAALAATHPAQGLATTASQTTPSAQVTEADPGSARVENPISAFFDEFYKRDFARALALASALDIPDTNEARGVQSVMRAVALLGLKRRDEAVSLFAEADRLHPNEPMLSSLQFEAGLMMEDWPVAAVALDRMIARFPNAVREISMPTMGYFLSEEPEDQKRSNEQRRVALAMLGFGGSQGDDLTVGAVRILLKQGDIAGAGDLLRYVDEPQLVEDMLVQRQFAPLWPRIEDAAGPRLHKMRTASVAAAEQDYARSPNDPKQLQILVNAYRHAGRLDDAIALRSKLPSSSAAMAAVDEPIGWAVNNVALALHQVGNGDEADRLFEMLNTAPMEQGRGRWRVSMIINRLELLVADGKFDKAAPLLELTERSAQTDGNAYAQQLVRRLTYCTLQGLGRKVEAAAVLVDLLKNASSSYRATIDGLLCGGELDKAEEVALTAVDDEQFQSDFARALQAVPLTSDDPSVWAHQWHALRKRPAIAKEFDRIARDLPQQLLAPATASARPR